MSVKTTLHKMGNGLAFRRLDKELRREGAQEIAEAQVRPQSGDAKKREVDLPPVSPNSGPRASRS